MRVFLRPASLSRSPMRFHWYDLLVAAIAPVISFWLRDDTYFSREKFDAVLMYTAMSVACGVASLMYFRVNNIMNSYYSSADAVRTMKAAFSAVALTSVLGFTLTRLNDVPRSLPAIHLLVLMMGLIVGRFALSQLSHKKLVGRQENGAAGEDHENILVVGANRLAWFYVRIVESLTQDRQRIVAILDADPHLKGRSFLGHLVTGSPYRIAAIIEEYAQHGVVINRVMVAYARQDVPEGLWHVLESECARADIALGSIHEKLNLQDGTDDSEDTAPAIVPPIALDPFEAARNATRRFWLAKRVLDTAVVAVTAIVWVPLAVLVGLAIMLGLGTPVVFWQRRLGKGGGWIYVFKFRTMKPVYDAAGNKRSDEERETRLGRFLRKTRLDELPQLYNVLRGDMSLIGPRPLLPVDQPEGESIRLLVRPGITGWAQVHGGKLIGPQEKNALDEWYIRHASFALDFKIFLRTLRVMYVGDRLDHDEVRAALAEVRTDTSSQDGPGAVPETLRS